MNWKQSPHKNLIVSDYSFLNPHYNKPAFCSAEATFVGTARQPPERTFLSKAARLIFITLKSDGDMWYYQTA